MLSGRRATSSLLRQSARRAAPPSHLAAALSSSTPDPSSRLKPRRKHVTEVLKTFEQVEASGTLNLTANEASKLVLTLSRYKLHDQCAQLVRSCQEHELPLQPSARINGFNALWLQREYDAVLREFDALKSDNWGQLPPWVVAAALDAAVKLDRPDAVKSIFQMLLRGSEVPASGDTVAAMLQDVQQRGVKLSAFAFRSLAAYAEKSQQAAMGLEVLAMMKARRVKPTVDVYSSLFVACGKENQWPEAIDVFEGMPRLMLSQLDGIPLGYVIMAHSKSEDDELVLRGLDIYGKHMHQNWDVLACTAALEGLLRTGQYDVLQALAKDMTRHNVNWTPSVFKLVTLAHIRQGSIETARKLVHDNAKVHMRGVAADCYRELIAHYANTGGDTKEACQLYLEMMQNRMQLSFSDWVNALELSLQSADHTVYWSFRKQMALFARHLEKDLPADLRLPLLPALDDAQRQPRVSFSATASASFPDVALALKIFGDVQEAGGAGLTVNVASDLLWAMAQAHRPDECVKMWRYFEQQGVLPKPFARAAAFRTLSSTRKYEDALEMFQTLLHGDVPPGALAYSKALVCAIRLKRYAFVTETLRHLQAHGVEMTTKDFATVITSCVRAKEWALALSMVAAMRTQGLEPASTTFNALLAGCAEDKFWNMVIEVYNGMPEDRQSEIDGRALGAVFTAFSLADNEELRSRIAELYEKHGSCESFPFEAAMAAFLEAKQFQEVLSVGSDATKQELKWTPSMYRSAVLANIRSGAMEQARDLLRGNVMRMNGCSVECYRELIRYYAEVRGDVLEASTLCLQMMQNNAVVTTNDWSVALELALRLPDRSIYRELRKWLRLHGNTPLSDIREHLLLPDDDQQPRQQDQDHTASVQ